MRIRLLGAATITIRKMFLILALASLLASPAFAQALGGGNLQTAFLPAGGVLPCDGIARTYTWGNPTNGPIYLRHLRLWQGVDRNTIADIGGNVYASHPATGITQPVLLSSWDHYAEPTGQHFVDLMLAPDYITLAVGEWLTLEVNCTLGTGSTSGAEQNLMIYYLTSGVSTEVP